MCQDLMSSIQQVLLTEIQPSSLQQPLTLIMFLKTSLLWEEQNWTNNMVAETNRAFVENSSI